MKSTAFYDSTVRPTVEEFFSDDQNLRRGRLAAIVLYHMADYWFQENKFIYKDLSQVHKELINVCPGFQLIRDIADASKHAELSVQKNIPRMLSISEQVSTSPGLFHAPFGTGVFYEASIIVANMDDGSETPIAQAISSVNEMWKLKISSVI